MYIGAREEKGKFIDSEKVKITASERYETNSSTELSLCHKLKFSNSNKKIRMCGKDSILLQGSLNNVRQFCLVVSRAIANIYICIHTYTLIYIYERAIANIYICIHTYILIYI